MRTLLHKICSKLYSVSLYNRVLKSAFVWIFTGHHVSTYICYHSWPCASFLDKCTPAVHTSIKTYAHVTGLHSESHCLLSLQQCFCFSGNVGYVTRLISVFIIANTIYRIKASQKDVICFFSNDTGQHTLLQPTTLQDPLQFLS